MKTIKVKLTQEQVRMFVFSDCLIGSNRFSREFYERALKDIQDRNLK